jgi:hypothetical protein
MVQCEEHCTLHIANVRSWAAEINVRMAAVGGKPSSRPYLAVNLGCTLSTAIQVSEVIHWAVAGAKKTRVTYTRRLHKASVILSMPGAMVPRALRKERPMRFGIAIKFRICRWRLSLRLSRR